jgi:hypothetical protein
VAWEDLAVSECGSSVTGLRAGLLAAGSRAATIVGDVPGTPVAASGDRFLLLHSGTEFTGALLDSAGALVAGPSVLRPGAAGSPTAAYDGAGFLAAWIASDGTGSRGVVAGRISASGSPVDAAPIPPWGAGRGGDLTGCQDMCSSRNSEWIEPSAPAVACLEGACLVVGVSGDDEALADAALHVARIDGASATPVGVLALSFVKQGLAAGESAYLVAWNEDVSGQPGYRKFSTFAPSISSWSDRSRCVSWERAARSDFAPSGPTP